MWIYSEPEAPVEYTFFRKEYRHTHTEAIQENRIDLQAKSSVTMITQCTENPSLYHATIALNHSHPLKPTGKTWAWNTVSLLLLTDQPSHFMQSFYPCVIHLSLFFPSMPHPTTNFIEVWVHRTGSQGQESESATLAICHPLGWFHIPAWPFWWTGPSIVCRTSRLLVVPFTFTGHFTLV